MEILSDLKQSNPEIPVIMITGHGDIKTAIKAIKIGAYDFLEKPFNLDKLTLTINRALDLKNLLQENKKLIQNDNDQNFLIGTSGIIQNLNASIKEIAKSNSRIYITGETGTGKRAIAYCIHKESNKNKDPFILLNCATLNEKNLNTVLNSSLKKASKGTLFLNEITDMDLEIQGKFLALMHDYLNQNPDDFCRIISSSCKDIEQLIEKGKFRQDLFYRLNVVKIQSIPLKERIEDLPFLCESFIHNICENMGLEKKTLSEDAILALKRYNWHGNIMELKNVCQSIVIMNQNKKKIDVDLLPKYILNNDSEKNKEAEKLTLKTQINKPIKDAREIFEKQYLKDQLERFNWNISDTAKFIQMERSALHKKIKSLNIKNKKLK
jgi:two-component system nitrogen regulation response regulator NtrX